MSQVDLKKKYLRRAHHLMQRVGSSGKVGKLQANVEPIRNVTERSVHSRENVLGEWNDSCSDSDSLSLTSHRSSLSQLASDPQPSSPAETRPIMTSSVLGSPLQYSSPPPRSSAGPISGSGIPSHVTPISRQPSVTSALQSQLKVQTDVNKELKRLLVASVGSDLQYRLQQLAQEKAELARDLDLSLQQVVNNNEEIDQVSIECDIWRSKFIASRVMIDELASWKAELSLQLRESRRALQYLMKEREDICRELVECNVQLQKAVTELERLAGRTLPCEVQAKAVGSARIATVSPVQYFSKGPLLSVAGDESVPKVTVLDLARSNMTTARELSPLIHMVAGQRQENHRDTDVKSKANPVEVSRTIELTAGERLAQGVIDSRQDSSGRRELSPSLPKLLVTDEDLVHHRSSTGTSLSPLSRRLFHFGAKALEDPFRIPFQCRHCKGSIIVV